MLQLEQKRDQLESDVERLQKLLGELEGTVRPRLVK